MKILVIGAGAIGCLVGGQLATAGHTLFMLGRNPLVQAVKASGLRLYWPDGIERQTHPQVFEVLGDIKKLDEIDLVLVTVKSFDTATAVAGLEGGLNKKTPILSLQNGVGNEEVLTQCLPDYPIIAGSITLPVQVPEIGKIVVSKNKGGIGLAPFNDAVDSTALAAIAQAMREVGFTTFVYRNHPELKWSKLLMNIMCNAACAIVNMPPSDLLEEANLFNLELAAMRETLAVMEAQGMPVVNLPSYPLTSLAIALGALPNLILRPILRPIMAGGRGGKLPSLLLDLKSGRNQSEVNMLNKAVVIAGQNVDVATPVNQGFSEILGNIVAGLTLWSDYQENPAALYQSVLTYYK